MVILCGPNCDLASLGPAISELWGTLAAWEHTGGPWEQQKGHLLVQSLFFMIWAGLSDPMSSGQLDSVKELFAALYQGNCRGRNRSKLWKIQKLCRNIKIPGELRSYV